MTEANESTATPGPADEIGEPPALYGRWWHEVAGAVTDADITSAWRITFPAHRKFWTKLDAQVAAQGALLEVVSSSLACTDCATGGAVGAPVSDSLRCKHCVPDAEAPTPAMTPAVGRLSAGDVLVLAIAADASETWALEAAATIAALNQGIAVVTVRGVEALRTWHPAGTPELDQTPAYWVVRTALTTAVHALQLVKLSDRDDLAATATEAIAKVDEIMARQPDDEDELRPAHLVPVNDGDGDL